ncbi:hypothetical protein EVAR_6610_1 [Eumeta japonica]|uniref:Uncharacterized protein n=1 Tax=Eumeta variegata TaxID=151549 RepID=A0A4C1TN59_EUMVA|nr:hypothetical protein EVAR_6610_1 [Eumeta japonica]
MKALAITLSQYNVAEPKIGHERATGRESEAGKRINLINRIVGAIRNINRVRRDSVPRRDMESVSWPRSTWITPDKSRGPRARDTQRNQTPRRRHLGEYTLDTASPPLAPSGRRTSRRAAAWADTAPTALLVLLCQEQRLAPSPAGGGDSMQSITGDKEILIHYGEQNLLAVKTCRGYCSTTTTRSALGARNKGISGPHSD